MDISTNNGTVVTISRADGEILFTINNEYSVWLNKEEADKVICALEVMNSI